MRKKKEKMTMTNFIEGRPEEDTGGAVSAKGEWARNQKDPGPSKPYAVKRGELLSGYGPCAEQKEPKLKLERM